MDWPSTCWNCWWRQFVWKRLISQCTSSRDVWTRSIHCITSKQNLVRFTIQMMWVKQVEILHFWIIKNHQFFNQPFFDRLHRCDGIGGSSALWRVLCKAPCRWGGGRSTRAGDAAVMSLVTMRGRSIWVDEFLDSWADLDSKKDLLESTVVRRCEGLWRSFIEELQAFANMESKEDIEGMRSSKRSSDMFGPWRIVHVDHDPLHDAFWSPGAW